MISFREHDIRPIDTAAEQKKRFENDIARLLRSRSQFVDVPCPACANGESSDRFTKYTLSYRECRSCGTVYLSPRPPPPVLKDYYAHSENYAFWNEVIFPASEAVRRERIFRPRVERVLALCAAHEVSLATLVEVGAGFGTFCEELLARDVFERVLAVEPTPELAETCRKRGIEVLEGTIEDVNIDCQADVVVSFEVIEHLFEPAVFVRSVGRLIKPGGLLVLTCPNVKGFDVEVLGAHSPAVDPEHLNYFHPASLGHLLKTNGFQILDVQTPGRLDADIVRNRVLSGEFDLSDRFLRHVLIDEWDRLGNAFQDFLVQNGLSSNMWVAARRHA